MVKAQQGILYCAGQLLLNQWREERRPLSLQTRCYLYLRFCLLVRTWVIFWGHPLSTCSNFFHTFSSCTKWTLNCFRCFARWKNLFPCLFISEFLRLPSSFEMRTLLIIEFFILSLSFSHTLICMYICMHACVYLKTESFCATWVGLELWTPGLQPLLSISWEHRCAPPHPAANFSLLHFGSLTSFCWIIHWSHWGSLIRNKPFALAALESSSTFSFQHSSITCICGLHGICVTRSLSIFLSI